MTAPKPVSILSLSTVNKYVSVNISQTGLFINYHWPAEMHHLIILLK